MVTLVQPNKFSLGGGPESPLLSYTAIKGSSFLYQAFRQIFSLWRPFYTPETATQDKFMSMAIIKNDLGKLDTQSFNWDGSRGKITPMSERDKFLLDQWLLEREEAKSESGDSQWS